MELPTDVTIVSIMTHFGEFVWTPGEVHVFLAKARKEVNDPKLRAQFFKKKKSVCVGAEAI